MSKIDLISESWLELVFEGKNKEYGAYKLRKNTGRRNVWAMVLTFSIFLFIGLAVWTKGVIENALKDDTVAITSDVELTQIKKAKKVEEEKPVEVVYEEKQIIEKVKSSIKFTVPKIEKDEDVKEDDQLKTQEDLFDAKTAIGAFNVEGNDEAEGEVLKAKQEIADEVEEEKVFDVVEQMPSYPGGDAALFKYLSDNIKYPTIAEENGVQGRVIVTFVVERDGSITDVKIVRAVDPSLDREAVRVVKSMPSWIPGKQNGKSVRVKYTLPVTFRLQ